MATLKDIVTQSTLPIKIQKAEMAVSATGKQYQKLAAVDQEGKQEIIYNFNPTKMDMEIPCVINASLSRKNGYLNLDSFQISDLSMVLFLPAARIPDKKAAWNSMLDLCKKIERKGLYKVTGRVLSKHQKAFTAYPLSAGDTFYRHRGLFEYSLILARQAYAIASLTGLDKSLCIAGGLLYHIGCVRTLTPGFIESKLAILEGEQVMSVNILQEAVTSIMESEDTESKALLIPEEIDALKHILHSSEGGIYPVFPEAILLRYLDKSIRLSAEAAEALNGSQPGEVVEKSKTNRYQNKLIKLL